MSGGFFGDYCYFQVSQFARDLEEEIKNNSMKDDCGYYTGYSKETIEYLKEQVHYIHKIADIMYHIDRLIVTGKLRTRLLTRILASLTSRRMMIRLTRVLQACKVG